MATDPGWTEAEYMQCPELAGRLHDHILNLQAEVERLRSERDRAIETRENANSVSVRVQIENQRLRAALERIDGMAGASGNVVVAVKIARDALANPAADESGRSDHGA